MEYSIRLARAAAVMTWLCLVVATAAVAVMAHVAAPPGVVIHEYSYYGWQAFGVVVIAFALLSYFQYDTLIVAWLTGFYPTGQIGL